MKMIIYSLSIPALLCAIFIVFNLKSNGKNEKVEGVSTAYDNTQTQNLSLLAKNGYNPSVINAKPDIKSILNIETKNTYDCSSLVVIPRLKIQKSLPPSGDTKIEIPAQEPGSTLQGMCAMGMYSFSINFNN